MAKLPAKYAYLRQEPLPPLMVRIALDMLGTIETQGTLNNPVILGWADEVAKICGGAYNNWAADFFNKDSIPWCGLFMGVVSARASQGRDKRFPPKNYLAALSWASYGVPVDIGRQAGKTAGVEVGDVLVMTRKGGGHVCIAVACSADGKFVMGLGGNQGDAVNIRELPADRLYAVRRPAYDNKPAGARRVTLAATGEISTGEA